MLPLTVQSRYLRHCSISHKEYKVRNEGGDAQSHWVRCLEFSFAFSISHFSLQTVPRNGCQISKCYYMGHFEKNKFRNTKHLTIKRYIATSISLNCIGSYGPASHFLPPQENTKPFRLPLLLYGVTGLVHLRKKLSRMIGLYRPRYIDYTIHVLIVPLGTEGRNKGVIKNVWCS
jgi:hypothetical protein